MGTIQWDVKWVSECVHVNAWAQCESVCVCVCVCVYRGGQMGSGQMLWIIKHRWRTDRRLTCLRPRSPSFHVAPPLTPLCPSSSGSLTTGCSSNICTNSVVTGPRITSLPRCLSPSFPPPPLPPFLPRSFSISFSFVSSQSGQREDHHHYQRWTGRWEGCIFIFAVFCHLSISRPPGFKQPGAQGAASLPVGSLGPRGLMHPPIIFNNEPMW